MLRIRISICLLVLGALIPTSAFAQKSLKKEMIPSKESVRVLKYFSMLGPKGWNCVDDESQLPGKIALIFVGTGTKGGFTPSINVAMEETKMTLPEYVALAKDYHLKQGETKCQRLGAFETQSGPSEVLQIDRKTQWGDVRFIQASMIKEGKAYVITATCLTEEFSTHSPLFFRSIQSFSTHPFSSHPGPQATPSGVHKS